MLKPTPEEKTQLWEELGHRCDACLRKIDRAAGQIPFQHPTLAQGGYAASLCASCAHDGLQPRHVPTFFIRVTARMAD